MKNVKSIAKVLVVSSVALFGAYGVMSGEEWAKAPQAPEEQHVPIGTNVGNGEPYTYEITEVAGDEIHGVALDKISNDNRGIFLLADEVPFETKSGDKITVVWGEYEDEFVSIERVVTGGGDAK